MSKPISPPLAMTRVTLSCVSDASGSIGGGGALGGKSMSEVKVAESNAHKFA